MFRSAIARSAPALVRRAVVSVPRPATRLLSVAAAAATAPRHAMRRVAPQVAAVQGMRYYSAGGALVKTEVEGRIMSLLAGFDKVGGFVFVSSPSSMQTPVFFVVVVMGEVVFGQG